MLNIFICDNNPDCLSMIENCIKNYISFEEIPFTMGPSFTSPHELLHHLEQNKGGTSPFGAYFLDIHLEDKDPIKRMDGIDLAKEIRKYDPRGFIVFITIDPDLLPVSVEKNLEVLNYIVKNEYAMEEKICKCIDSIYENLTAPKAPQTEKLVLKLSDEMRDRMIFVNFSDIVYFHSSAAKHHTTVLHTSFQRYETREPLVKILSRLDERFFKCHRNTVVNLEKITALDNKERKVYLSSNHEVYAANRSFGELKRMIEPV